MTPFEEASFPPEELQRVFNKTFAELATNRELQREAFGRENPSIEEIEKVVREIVERESKGQVFLNDKYQVIKRDNAPEPGCGWPDLVYLSIKRIDKQPIHDWRELQEIKNQPPRRCSEPVPSVGHQAARHLFPIWVHRPDGIRPKHRRIGESTAGERRQGMKNYKIRYSVEAWNKQPENFGEPVMKGVRPTNDKYGYCDQLFLVSIVETEDDKLSMLMMDSEAGGPPSKETLLMMKKLIEHHLAEHSGEEK